MKKRSELFLKELNEYKSLVYLVPISLYIVGFLIVNFHLGSLGVVSFTLLKPRYLLVGTVFSIWFMLLIGITRGLFRRMMHENKLNSKIYDVVSYSVIIVFLLLLMASAIQSYSGIPEASYQTHTNSINTYFIGNIENIAVESFIIFTRLNSAIYIVGFILLLVYLIFPFKHLRRKLVSLPKILIVTLFTIYLFSLYFHVNSQYKVYSGCQYMEECIEPVIDFFPYVDLLLLLYISIGILIVLFYILYRIHLKSKFTDAGDDDSLKFQFILDHPLLTYILFVLLFTLPLYAKAIYPSLPQQIGGGAFIPANIEFVPENRLSRIDTNNTYIIDKTDNNIILIIYGQDKYNIYEVLLEDIEVIEYNIHNNSDIDVRE